MAINVQEARQGRWRQIAAVTRLACVALIAATAVTAPINPNTIMTRGVWIAAPIIVLCWPRLTRLDLAALTLPAWVTITAYGSTWLAPVHYTVWAYWSAAALFVAARCALQHRRDILVVCCAYLAGSVYAAGRLIQAGRELTIDPYPTLTRAALDGINPNYTAYALATAVLVAAVALRTCKPAALTRTAIWLALPLIGYGILLTDTRGALAAAVAVAVYWAVSAWSPRAAWATVTAAAVVLLLVVPMGWLGDDLLLWAQRFFTRQDDSLSGRMPVWEYARDVWQQHPWTGIGVGMFPIDNPAGIGAHNIVLTLLVETGLIGLVLYATVMAGALVGRRATPGRYLVGGMAVAAWLPMWLTGHWELSPAAWLVAAVCSRLVVGLDRRGGAHRARPPSTARVADPHPLAGVR